MWEPHGPQPTGMWEPHQQPQQPQPQPQQLGKLWEPQQPAGALWAQKLQPDPQPQPLWAQQPPQQQQPQPLWAQEPAGKLFEPQPSMPAGKLWQPQSTPASKLWQPQHSTPPRPFTQEPERPEDQSWATAGKIWARAGAEPTAAPVAAPEPAPQGRLWQPQPALLTPDRGTTAQAPAPAAPATPAAPAAPAAAGMWRGVPPSLMEQPEPTVSDHDSGGFWAQAAQGYLRSISSLPTPWTSWSKSSKQQPPAQATPTTPPTPEGPLTAGPSLRGSPTAPMTRAYAPVPPVVDLHSMNSERPEGAYARSSHTEGPPDDPAEDVDGLLRKDPVESPMLHPVPHHPRNGDDILARLQHITAKLSEMHHGGEVHSDPAPVALRAPAVVAAPAGVPSLDTHAFPTVPGVQPIQPIDAHAFPAVMPPGLQPLDKHAAGGWNAPDPDIKASPQLLHRNLWDAHAFPPPPTPAPTARPVLPLPVKKPQPPPSNSSKPHEVKTDVPSATGKLESVKGPEPAEKLWSHIATSVPVAVPASNVAAPAPQAPAPASPKVEQGTAASSEPVAVAKVAPEAVTSPEPLAVSKVEPEQAAPKIAPAPFAPPSPFSIALSKSAAAPEAVTPSAAVPAAKRVTSRAEAQNAFHARQTDATEGLAAALSGTVPDAPLASPQAPAPVVEPSRPEVAEAPVAPAPAVTGQSAAQPGSTKVQLYHDEKPPPVASVFPAASPKIVAASAATPESAAETATPAAPVAVQPALASAIAEADSSAGVAPPKPVRSASEEQDIDSALAEAENVPENVIAGDADDDWMEAIEGASSA